MGQYKYKIEQIKIKAYIGQIKIYKLFQIIKWVIYQQGREFIFQYCNW